MRGGQHSDLSCLVDPPGPSYRVEGGGVYVLNLNPDILGRESRPVIYYVWWFYAVSVNPWISLRRGNEE